MNIHIEVEIISKMNCDFCYQTNKLTCMCTVLQASLLIEVMPFYHSLSSVILSLPSLLMPTHYCINTKLTSYSNKPPQSVDSLSSTTEFSFSKYRKSFQHVVISSLSHIPHLNHEVNFLIGKVKFISTNISQLLITTGKNYFSLI
jgi:hypothetical protein